MQPPAPDEGKAAMRAYRRVQRPFAFIGFLLFFVGLRFFLDPHAAEEATAVGRQTTGLVPVLWSLMFVVGGAGLLYGTQRPDLRVERAAHILSAAAVAVNAAALAYGYHRPTAILAILPHALLVGLFAERVKTLTHLDRAAAP